MKRRLLATMVAGGTALALGGIDCGGKTLGNTGSGANASDAGSGNTDSGNMPDGGTGGFGGQPADGFGGEAAGAQSASGAGPGYGTGGVAALPECESNPVVADAIACVTNESGALINTSTMGKVTVLDVVQGVESRCLEGGFRPSTHILLTNGADVWVLDARIPGYAQDLVKKGDVLDFRLVISDGYIPLSPPPLDQTFALLGANGSILLFAANLHGQVPIPNLAFLGVAIEDLGPFCDVRRPRVECSYEMDRARFTLGSVSGDLTPNETSSIGNLTVTLSLFDRGADVGIGAGSSNCDGSGYTIIVGADTGGLDADTGGLDASPGNDASPDSGLLEP